MNMEQDWISVLINEVEAHPAIWDVVDVNYNSTTKRTMAFEAVAGALQEKFPDIPELLNCSFDCTTCLLLRCCVSGLFANCLDSAVF